MRGAGAGHWGPPDRAGMASCRLTLLMFPGCTRSRRGAWETGQHRAPRRGGEQAAPGHSWGGGQAQGGAAWSSWNCSPGPGCGHGQRWIALLWCPQGEPGEPGAPGEKGEAGDEVSSHVRPPAPMKLSSFVSTHACIRSSETGKRRTRWSPWRQGELGGGGALGSGPHLVASVAGVANSNHLC